MGEAPPHRQVLVTHLGVSPLGWPEPQLHLSPPATRFPGAGVLDVLLRHEKASTRDPSPAAVAAPRPCAPPGSDPGPSAPSSGLNGQVPCRVRSKGGLETVMWFYLQHNRFRTSPDSENTEQFSAPWGFLGHDFHKN